MSLPLGPAIAARVNSVNSSNPDIVKRCSKCHQEKPTSAFDLQTRGPGKVSSWPQHAETAQIPGAPESGRKKKLVSKKYPSSTSAASATSWRDTVQAKGCHLALKRVFEKKYLESRKKKAKKVANEARQRDTQGMERFECAGNISINLAMDLDPDGYADIGIIHEVDHVPYCWISLPEEVRDYIKNNLTQKPTQIWNDICQKYTNPTFIRNAVYALWNHLTPEAGKVGHHAVEKVDITAPEGMSVMAFAIPDMLTKWASRIREAALDSAWNTNQGGYEVFALLGEAYGSGLPLGYLFVKKTGDPAPNAKTNILEQFLQHFRDKWNLQLKFTLSDKDPSEISAFRAMWPKAKHQLCFWHCLRSMKTRLSVLKRQPAHYNVVDAVQEFSFIDKTFLPLTQQPKSALDIVMTQKPVQWIVVRDTIPSDTSDEPPVPSARAGSTPSGPHARRLVVRLGGKVVTVLDYPTQSEDAAEEAKDAESESDDSRCKNRRSTDLLEQVRKEIADCETSIDTEDAPDWEFEDGETKSKDADYVFCPAPHRAAILWMFTLHFCWHPIFLARLENIKTAEEIRRCAVTEMYMHCKRNGLTEVWAYAWNQWYRPDQWKLWARSASPLLSRLQTTMTVENHWKVLKHHYLHNLHRPRLDHALFIVFTNVIPAFMCQAETLEDRYRLGRAKALTTFQKAFKRAWQEKAMKEIQHPGKYAINTHKWQCNCGGQATDTHHLCKHLVQAVAPPPPKFFSEVVHRRTVPLYHHPLLGQLGNNPLSYSASFDGSIMDGDDHDGISSKEELARARMEDGKGWVSVLSGEVWAEGGTAKRKCVAEESDSDGQGRGSKLRMDVIEVSELVDDEVAAGGREGTDEVEEEDDEELQTLYSQLNCLAHNFE
ncbi:hypothetical protein FRB99_000926 [Tulasnella sp. 403]|nr:hypothetical protein FRB99_000926 [Tulasnella sp. 403]